MFLKNLKILTKDINRISKKKRKIRIFIISNTADKSVSKYLTPIRESLNCIYAGAVVYDDNTAKKICLFLKKKIDYIFVDTEKKAALDKKTGTINIERVVRENFELDKIFYFKANDLTVESASNFLEMLFQKDIRNISNKKVLIIGAGNIGFKLGLKLIERGVKVFLNGKTYESTNKLITVINRIKPSATLNKAKNFSNIKKDFSKFDIIVNASNSQKIIFKKKDLLFKKNIIFLEIGKNLFSIEALNKYIKNNIKIYRLDVTQGFNELIEKKINTKDQWKKTKFIRILKKNLHLVSKGLLGKEDDIIVDNPIKPKIIYGVVNNIGKIRNLSIKEKNQIFKKLK